MTVTVTGPLATPANVVLTAVNDAAGALAATTWYVRVCAFGVDALEAAALETQCVATRSAPSVEASVVVTAPNDAIDVTWDAVSGAAGYNVYFRRASESDYATKRYAVRGIQLTSVVTNALRLLATTERGGGHDTFAITTAYSLPGAISAELGTIIVDLSGVCGTVTYDTIYTAVNAAGYAAYIAWDPEQFVVKGTLQVLSGATGTISAIDFRTASMRGRGARWIALQGNFLNLASGFTWTWGTATTGSTLSLWSYYGVPSTKYMVMTGAVVVAQGWSSPSVLYISGGGQNLYIAADSGDVAKMTIRGVNLVMVAAALSDISAEGCYLCPNAASITFTRCQAYALRTADTGYTGAKMVQCRTHGARDLYVTGDMGEVKFLDCRFFSLAMVERTDPIAYWFNTSTGSTYLLNGYTFRLRVTDEQHVAVSGATVSLVDKNGTSVFSTTTDANGLIAEQEIYVAKFTWDGATTRPTLVSEKTDYAPFTLTVAKAGFATHVSRLSPVSRINEVVALDRRLDFSKSRHGAVVNP